MKSMLRALMIAASAVSLIWVAAYARELGAREARKAIAEGLGFENPDGVRIKSIGTPVGGDATVEATIDSTFHLKQDKDGKWKAVEVRTGDRRWESFELIQTAVRKEKALRTTADLRAIATALEAFKREQGHYVAAGNCIELIDLLSPRYLPSVIRLDAWSHEFEYKGTSSGYRLASRGPDGKPGTGDEIEIKNGLLVKGAGDE
ncbi:MAG TPA: type II secretion system protein GspG [Blastocatellia bacterium]|nr:type II secretion system protein GspG [Blastocatellia bacterium]